MKRTLSLLIAVFALLIFTQTTFAQGGAKNGPDPATIRDPELEKDSLHNLEVARHYFKLKKAYVAALNRCEEVIAGNPNFAKMDEILFIAGESSLRLSENKGKQTEKQKKPAELREDARTYLSQIVNDYPQSQFRKQAEQELQALGGPKPKSAEGAKP
jgi:outer membrane protein assembly factor BamD (BamD/ComL family)